MDVPPLPVGRKAGAFFDLEKTLSRDAVEQAIALTLYRRGELRLRHLLRVLWIYLRYNLGLIKGFDAMKRSGAVIFRGRSHAADREIVTRLYPELRKNVYPQARALVGAFQQAGYETYIVSATYAFMVEPYAAELAMHGHYGVELELKDGVCTGALTGRIPHQHEKAACVRETAARRGLDLALSFAFGDSGNDAEMLAAVGQGVAVNPAAGLRRRALASGWKILEWR